MRTSVMVLSNEELDERYSSLSNTRMAKLTREAIERGYSIALVEKEGLRKEKWLSHLVRVVLEQSVPRSSVIKLWRFTDMSQLDEDRIYVAFKELKFQACAHGMSPDHCRISD